MKKPRLLISLLTKEDTNTLEFGQRVLSVLYEHYPKLAPEYASHIEPVRNSATKADEALKYWLGDTFIWKRKHAVTGEGTALHTGVYGMGALKFRYQWNEKIDWFDLFQRLVDATDAEFGYLHLFTDPEIFGALFASPEHTFQLGVSENSLKNGIPNLGWTNYFAGAYADKVDMDLLKDKTFEIQKLKHGYLFNVTPNISDVIDHFQNFSERRELLKRLFPKGVFAEWKGDVYC